ncbi:hypothetical protein EIN_055350 [Entamoeba invadens IP1]|uniref:Spermidine synthase n=1 Tax=Entamoeba invadens TaxID=33085 RepID=S0B4U2_ENTIV|nr:hypothetical protein EIN_055350 [Entamoeba invadens IP1]ELP93220.1 hypothetical protein EIN_055350 [Entamoeba invadens IP1]BAN40847.1 hypothetical protein, conserved [Entamoeba invadens]|eukprot:XP_004259991.1 hypothetical protein EIN_055350 [Entamoeba invadens IP1]
MGLIHNLSESEISVIVPGRVMSTPIYITGCQTPKYLIDIVDLDVPNEEVGLAVVEQGKETDWVFCTHEGRVSLATDFKHRRLLIVSIDIHNSVSSVESIKSQLIAIKFALSHVKANKKVFIHINEENGVGFRKLLFEKQSKINGNIWVEDSYLNKEENLVSRKLMFSGDRSLIQSEAVLENGTINIVKSINNVLYFKAIILGVKLALLDKESDYDKTRSVLVIGGGANLLSVGIQRLVKNTSVTSVELDPVVAEAAQQCYNTENISTIIGDGIEIAKNNYSNCVVIDVDNKVNSDGIGAPPEIFISEDVIKMMKERLIGTNPFIVYNTVIRNEIAFKTVSSRIRKMFKRVYQWESESDLNVVFFCFVNDFDMKKDQDSLGDKQFCEELSELC